MRSLPDRLETLEIPGTCSREKESCEFTVIDVALPGLNGIEVLKRIRAINPAIGVIMVTGTTDPQLVLEALELGAIAYVDKPFDLTTLRRVVATALRPDADQPEV